jgi:hypothetical protein
MLTFALEAAANMRRGRKEGSKEGRKKGRKEKARCEASVSSVSKFGRTNVPGSLWTWFVMSTAMFYCSRRIEAKWSQPQRLMKARKKAKGRKGTDEFFRELAESGEHCVELLLSVRSERKGIKKEKEKYRNYSTVTSRNEGRERTAQRALLGQNNPVGTN